MIMIWGCPLIIKKDKHRENFDDPERIDWNILNSEKDNTFTKIIHGSQNSDNAIIAFVNRAREKIDSCVSSTAPSVFIEIKAIRDARIAAFKNKGVKLRDM